MSRTGICTLTRRFQDLCRKKLIVIFMSMGWDRPYEPQAQPDMSRSGRRGDRQQQEHWADSVPQYDELFSGGQDARRNGPSGGFGGHRGGAGRNDPQNSHSSGMPESRRRAAYNPGGIYQHQSNNEGRRNGMQQELADRPPVNEGPKHDVPRPEGIAPQ